MKKRTHLGVVVAGMLLLWQGTAHTDEHQHKRPRKAGQEKPHHGPVHGMMAESGQAGDPALLNRVQQLEEEVRQLKEALQQRAPTAGHGQPAATHERPMDRHGAGHEEHATGEHAPAASLSIEDRLKAVEDGTMNLWGIKFGGMLVTSYVYNFNTPDSRENSLRLLDDRHNNINLELLQLSISKEIHGIGFNAKIDIGQTAEAIASDWNGDGKLSNSEETNDFELQEAYITYTAPIGRGLQFKGGKFVTLVGAEVIESPLNYNVSRSFMFNYGIPFTHTGLLATYPFTDQVSLTGGVINGWDNVVDNNSSKSFIGQLALTPDKMVSWNINGIYGAEQNRRGGSQRGLLDSVLTVKPMDHLAMVLNYTRGSESRQPGTLREATWQGMSGILSLGGSLITEELEPFSVAFRGEWFADEDGARTGNKQDLWAFTSTLKWDIGHHLEARVEYRHDNSDNRSFERDIGRFRRQQNTLGAELALVF